MVVGRGQTARLLFPCLGMKEQATVKLNWLSFRQTLRLWSLEIGWQFVDQY